MSHAADAPLTPPPSWGLVSVLGARSVPDVERLRALADRAVATHEAIRLRTLGAPCAPA